MTEPVSGTPELLAQSPFAIPREDTDALCALPSIQVLRSYLTKTDTGYVTLKAVGSAFPSPPPPLAVGTGT